jgi:AraC-like DNA-binding protein
MANKSVYQNPVAKAFRAPDAPTLVTRALHKSTMAATELRCDQRNFGRTVSMPREDAYLIALQFRECHNHDLYFDSRPVQPKNYVAGVTSIYDLRHDPIADLRDPFHSIMFHLPCKALDAVAYEARAPRVGDLRHDPGVSVDDPVVRHLLSSLLPATAKPAEAPSMFLDHVALALTAHVACTYGGVNPNPGLPRGGLAPWQEKRAKELMSATLSEDVPLARLANECGLSVRHFARAFRQSTGTSPHRWLLKQRVEYARELLGNRGLSLSDVALSCGFADQSHFTRVFAAMIGVGPGAWRRITGPSKRHRSADVLFGGR